MALNDCGIRQYRSFSLHRCPKLAWKTLTHEPEKGSKTSYLYGVNLSPSIIFSKLFEINSSSKQETKQQKTKSLKASFFILSPDFLKQNDGSPDKILQLLKLCTYWMKFNIYSCMILLQRFYVCKNKKHSTIQFYML